MRRHCCLAELVSQVAEMEVVDAHGELVVEDRSRNFGVEAMIRRLG